MISHLYRFRPADAVLDKYEELSKQEIYFSPPGDLNDPMEGYKDVYWRGDRIPWRNMLRHYLLCLQESVARCLSLGPEFEDDNLNKTLFLSFNNLPLAPVRTIYQRACEAFFADANIDTLIDALAKRTSPLRRDELRHILRAIHPFALSVLMSEFKHHGIEGLFRDLDALRAQTERSSLKMCPAILSVHSFPAR